MVKLNFLEIGKRSMQEDIYALPIDQYTRQAWVRNVINALRSGHETFTILDVGGHKGKTRLFQNKDSVTISDLFDVEENGYVKTNGKNLPFADNSFDFVVSFDTYEHVPRAQRDVFLKEAYRVARKAVFVAAPFDKEKNGEISLAEKTLNQYHIDLYGTDHRWLREHIDYGIPTTEEIERLIRKAGMHFTSIPTNDIDIWLIIQTLYFSIELDTDMRGRVDDVNRMFNKDFEKYDKPIDSPYRNIYIISKDKKLIDKTQKYLDTLPTEVKNKVEFMSFALSVFGKKYRDTVTHDAYLEGETARLFEENAHLKEKSSLLDKIVKKSKRKWDMKKKI